MRSISLQPAHSKGKQEKKMGKGKLIVENSASVTGIVVTEIKINGQHVQLPSNLAGVKIPFGHSSTAIDLEQGYYQITASIPNNVNLCETKNSVIEAGKVITVVFDKIP
jgi:hypothetical protein